MIRKKLTRLMVVAMSAVLVVGFSACGKKKADADNKETEHVTLIAETKSIADKELAKTEIVTFEYEDGDGNIVRLEGKAVAGEDGNATIEVEDKNGYKVTFQGKASTDSNGKLQVSEVSKVEEGKSEAENETETIPTEAETQSEIITVAPVPEPDPEPTPEEPAPAPTPEPEVPETPVIPEGAVEIAGIDNNGIYTSPDGTGTRYFTEVAPSVIEIYVGEGTGNMNIDANDGGLCPYTLLEMTTRPYYSMDGTYAIVKGCYSTDAGSSRRYMLGLGYSKSELNDTMYRYVGTYDGVGDVYYNYGFNIP